MQEKITTFVEIGRRLEIERDRLRMKHTDFAKAGGVATSTYSNYSGGTREPKLSFLAAINEIGADVVYILTGNRMPMGVTESARAYSPSERAAVTIQSLKLTQEDAELVTAMANRLAKT